MTGGEKSADQLFLFYKIDGLDNGRKQNNGGDQIKEYGSCKYQGMLLKKVLSRMKGIASKTIDIATQK